MTLTVALMLSVQKGSAVNWGKGNIAAIGSALACPIAFAGAQAKHGN